MSEREDTGFGNHHAIIIVIHSATPKHDQLLICGRPLHLLVCSIPFWKGPHSTFPPLYVVSHYTKMWWFQFMSWNVHVHLEIFKSSRKFELNMGEPRTSCSPQTNICGSEVHKKSPFWKPHATINWKPSTNSNARHLTNTTVKLGISDLLNCISCLLGRRNLESLTAHLRM